MPTAVITGIAGQDGALLAALLIDQLTNDEYEMIAWEKKNKDS